MTVATINEPYAALLAVVTQQSSLLALLGKKADGVTPAYGFEYPADKGSFPCLTWASYLYGSHATLLTDFVGYHKDRLQFDLFGGDPEVMRTLCDLVDQTADYVDANAGCLDTEHFRCQAFRRQPGSAWRRIDWTGTQTAQGVQLLQFSSDWDFWYVRKQDVS